MTQFRSRCILRVKECNLIAPHPCPEDAAIYEEFYGFREEPFNTQPNPRFAYPSAEHEIAVAKMRYAADKKRGLVVLLGPVGAGKTTVANSLLRTWAEDGTKIVGWLPGASDRTQTAFLRKIVQAFGIDDQFPAGAERAKRTHTAAQNRALLERFMLDMDAEHVHPILLLDEGQDVHPNNIDTISELINFQTAETKFITIVMLAADNFPRKLDRKDAFRSRIAITGNLDPLTREDTAAMMQHRITTAGGGELSLYFTNDALDAVYDISDGIPRDICIIADTAFIEGYVRNVKTITPDIIQRVLKDNQESKNWPRKAKEEKDVNVRRTPKKDSGTASRSRSAGANTSDRRTARTGARNTKPEHD